MRTYVIKKISQLTDVLSQLSLKRGEVGLAVGATVGFKKLDGLPLQRKNKAGWIKGPAGGSVEDVSALSAGKQGM